MEENDYEVRIDDNFLRGDHVDGQVLQHTDLNELESVAKIAINANYEDIQKLQDGTIMIGNAERINGAELSTYSEETLQNSDTKVPTSMQVKQYVDSEIENLDIDNYYTKSEADDLLADKADVSAIPTKTSDLTNDSNYVADASYVHTDNNYTSADKNKLSGIATGAQANVIETVKRNGTALTVTNKSVDVTVPTKTSDLTNDSNFVTSGSLSSNYMTLSTDQTISGDKTFTGDLKALVGDATTLSSYLEITDEHTLLTSEDLGNATGATIDLETTGQLDMDAQEITIDGSDSVDINGGAVSIGGSSVTINNLVSPTNNSDATNKAYVDKNCKPYVLWAATTAQQKAGIPGNTRIEVHHHAKDGINYITPKFIEVVYCIASYDETLDGTSTASVQIETKSTGKISTYDLYTEEPIGMLLLSLDGIAKNDNGVNISFKHIEKSVNFAIVDDPISPTDPNSNYVEIMMGDTLVTDLSTRAETVDNTKLIPIYVLGYDTDWETNQ